MFNVWARLCLRAHPNVCVRVCIRMCVCARALANMHVKKKENRRIVSGQRLPYSQPGQILMLDYQQPDKGRKGREKDRERQNKENESES